VSIKQVQRNLISYQYLFLKQ